MPQSGVKRSAEAKLEPEICKKQVTSCLDAIKAAGTLIVADTADFGLLADLKAQDGTTNPTLILQASQIEAHQPVFEEAIASAKATGLTGEELVTEACDRCAVAIGCEILKIVPGLVSTEVDACLSFDTEKTVEKAKKIIRLYEERGISKDRVLIKIATTWEGCRASKQLESEGIRTNMTLLFSYAQAAIAAEANAYLISPFVGRILDFFKAQDSTKDYSGMNDPGVTFVTGVYNYYKKFKYETIVMGASFRSAEEIKNLAGCDRVTVSPKLIAELENDANASSVTQKLSIETAPTECCPEITARVQMTEAEYRWAMNEDEMATVKLTSGIRAFNADLNKLKDLIRKML